MSGADSADPGFTDQDSERLAGSRFAICVATFYGDLAERLLDGAATGFALAGVAEASIDTHRVPGAYELPLAARWCAESGRYAGVACLGAVIRGETDHYDHVCEAAARGIQSVGIDTGIPCAFGVITCDSMGQALARSGGEKRDQGRDAAIAVMRMAALRRTIAE